MNYRQWKKRYKKLHGYNPPDKRKMARLAAQQLSILMPQITEAINNFVPALCRALADACETMSTGFAAASKTFGEMAESYNQVSGKTDSGAV